MLPTDSKTRKNIPMARGCLDYFPDALAAVAQLSQAGNEKHNPGQPMHWSREKSSDHADCIMRHLADRGKIDLEDGILHDVKVAWRALAMLQLALEKNAAPMTATEVLERRKQWDGGRLEAQARDGAVAIKLPAGYEIP